MTHAQVLVLACRIRAGNLPKNNMHDARRIEVVCNGLPLWHGHQLAFDATVVSPVARDGEPRHGSHARAGVVLANAGTPVPAGSVWHRSWGPLGT